MKAKVEKDDSFSGELLTKWYNVNERIRILEEKREKYKAAVRKILGDQSQHSMETESFRVRMRDSVRRTISKGSVPDSIWDKYSTETRVTSLFLSKK